MAASTEASAPADRLMISKIVTENFKSYGGVKALGPFHKRMTCIVGPNGSGKSNSLDALVFAFGKRAAKLRLKKLSELIHKSEAYPDCEYCRVTVHFQRIIDTGDGDEDYDIVPGSEFQITREANKASTSKYYLNGKTSSFSAINDLLVGHGVDLINNRFLILQGEVEAISMMPPKGSDKGDEGLLEYLEEIIGSNKYIQPIEAAGDKLVQFDELRSEKLARVKVAEKEKGALESSKVEAEEYLSKQRELYIAQSALLQVHAAATASALTAAEEKRSGLSERLDTERARLAEAKGGVDTLAEEHAGANKALKAARSAAEGHRNAYTECEKEDIKLRAEVKTAKSKAKKAAKAVETHTAKADAAADASAALQAKLPELETRVQEAGADKDTAAGELQKVYDGLAERSSGIREKLEQKQAELAPWAEQVTQAAAAKAEAATTLAILQERTQGAAVELERAQGAVATLEGDIAAKSEELAAAQAQEATASKALDKAQKRLAAADAAMEEAKAAVEAAQRAFDERREALEANSSRGALLTGLMSAAVPGGPLESAGLAGRLGDLGTIDPKFDVAASTACGALNWLVVDNVEGGQACVEHLHSRKLGRARFIMLDKIGWTHAEMNKRVNVPEGAQRLFDLITPTDDKYAPAFFFGFRNTLVAKDLDSAVKIAYGSGGRCKWRVVTLAGEMIDTSGTMSGGGKSVKKGYMRTASSSGAAAASSSGGAAVPAVVTARDVADAERTLREANAALASARSQRADAAAEVAGLEETVSSGAAAALQQALETLSMKLSAAQSQLAAAQSAAEEAGADVSADDAAELEAAQAALEDASKAHAKACAHATKYESKVEALEAQLQGVGGDAVAAAKSAVKAATASLDASHRAVAKAQAELKQQQKTEAKSREAAEKAAKEAEAALARADEVKADFNALVDRAQAAQVAAQEATQAEDEARKVASSVAKRLDELRKTLESIRETEQDIATAMADVDGVLLAAKQTADKYAKQLVDVHSKYEACLDLVPEEDEDEEAGAAASGVPTQARTPPTLSEEELAGASKDKLRAAVALLESELKSLEGEVNLAAIADYRAKERDWILRVGELEGVSQARDKSKREFDALRSKRLDEFMSGFRIITLKLKEMYQMITLGGDAELELVDSLDPFSEGIVFSVRPPKKSWKNISNLSGGEKTLSSLALVFALHHFKPTPLYVMDEIDAALDFRNVSIVANYIKERTADAQFIIISLRNNMFELADRLVGIYKTHDVTKNVTINPKAFATGQENAAAGAGKAVRPPAVPAALGDASNQG